MISYKLLALHAHTSLVGSFGAVYALFPLIFAIPLGRWINHFGEGKFVTAGTLFISISALTIGLSNNYFELVLVVALMGTSQLLCMAGAQAIIANRSTSHELEKYFGYYTFSASLGQLIGPLVGSFVAGGQGTLPKSTSHAFLAASIISLLGTIPLFLKMPMRPSVENGKRNTRESTSLTKLLSNPGMFAAMFTSLTVSSTVDLLVVFLPVLGKEKGFTATSIGWILAIRAATSMISRFNLGKLSTVFGSNKLLYGSVVISSLSCVLAVFSRNATSLALDIAVAGFVLGIGQPMTMAWVSRISRDDERSFAISIRLAGNRLGQFILPALSGLLAGGFGASAVFYALALLMSSSLFFAKSK
jgi:MFS family permease